MRKIFPTLLLVAIISTLGGCSLDDGGTPIEFLALEIVEAEVPESFTMNGRYEISVTYRKPDNCTFFETFDVAKPDTTIREVVAIGYNAVDEVCAQEVTELQKSFFFEVIYDQPYLFKFWQGQDANGEPLFLEIEVPVN